MKQIVLLLAIMFTLCCQAQDIPDSKHREIVITGVSVIPMNKDTVLSNQTVVIKDGRIITISDVKKIKFTKEALIIDGKGKFLLPGLAEMHAHVPPVDDLAQMKEVMLLFMVNGVTTIRGMLGHPRHLELRSKIQSGEIPAPRFFTSGPSLNGNSVTSAAQADEMVRAQKLAGYDFLKLHPGLTKENFAAIVKTAKEVSMPFAGHVSYDVGVWRAIDAGYATIEHLDGFIESLVPGIENISEQENGIFGLYSAAKADESKIPALMKALREKNIWVVPTQSLAERWFSPHKDADAYRNDAEMKYVTPAMLNNWVNAKKNLEKQPQYNAQSTEHFIALRRKLIKACADNGVGLLLGSDAPQVFDVPGFSVHHELKYMVDAGLTTFQALQMGTVNVGKFYNNPDMGVIRKGALADLILLNGNPLADINQTKNIEGVLVNGRWVSKQSINKILQSLEKK